MIYVFTITSLIDKKNKTQKSNRWRNSISFNFYEHLKYLNTSVNTVFFSSIFGALWPWSYGSWIYNYLYNQCLSPLMWVQISVGVHVRCTTLCDKVCQWLVTGRWFSLVPPVSSTNKTDGHDITEIVLKVALSTIKQSNKQSFSICIHQVQSVKLYTTFIYFFKIFTIK